MMITDAELNASVVFCTTKLDISINVVYNIDGDMCEYDSGYYFERESQNRVYAWKIPQHYR